MARLSPNIDEHLLRLVRIRALKQGTTVNSLVREWLERYAADDRQRSASEKIVDLLARTTANVGTEPWTWDRDEIYDERVYRHGR